VLRDVTLSVRNNDTRRNKLMSLHCNNVLLICVNHSSRLYADLGRVVSSEKLFLPLAPSL
jgi:hypothetical protein